VSEEIVIGFIIGIVSQLLFDWVGALERLLKKLKSSSFFKKRRKML